MMRLALLAFVALVVGALIVREFGWLGLGLTLALLALTLGGHTA